jgi:hypothetical protein
MGGGGFRSNTRGGRDAAAGNKNLEFQYKVDLEESRDFLLVDSSKAYGGSGGGGGGGNYDSVKRFVPQARRKANTQRLRQLNARRNDGTAGGGGGGLVGRYNQPQRTRAGGR